MEANPQTEVSPEIIETDPQTNVTYLTFRKGSQPSPNIPRIISEKQLS